MTTTPDSTLPPVEPTQSLNSLMSEPAPQTLQEQVDTAVPATVDITVPAPVAVTAPPAQPAPIPNIVINQVSSPIIVVPKPDRYRTNATAFSFVGSTKRILRWTDSWVRDSPLPVKILGWVAISLLLLLAWTWDLAWYSFIYVFFFVVIPWRIIRRNHRAQRNLQEQQLDALRRLNGGL